MQKDDRIFAVVGALVVAVVGVIAAIIWLGTGITVDAPQRATVVVPLEPAQTPTASQESAAVAAEDEETGENEMVRRALAGLSAHPRFAAYLVNDRLLTRIVMAVDAIAGGYSPRDQVDFLRPQRPYLVREVDGRLVAAAGSHHRYDLAAEVFDSIAVDGMVDLYAGLRPRLEAIYEEIGWASEDFDTRLCEAVDHLLEAEPSLGTYELEQRATVYAYADDSVEQLSDAQKQLLRMGPDNARVVVNKLRELRTAMGWPERVPDSPVLKPESPVPDAAAPLVTAGASPALVMDPDEDRIGAVEAP